MNVPFALFWLQCGHTQKLIDRLCWIVRLYLFRIVVFVLYVDIAALLFIVVFVFKVVSGGALLAYIELMFAPLDSLFLVRILHEVIIV